MLRLSSFPSDVLGTTLTGLSTASNSAVTSSDSILIAIGKLQAYNNTSISITGDITGSGTTTIASTLATVNSNVGTFKNATVTVNGKGLVTAASSTPQHPTNFNGAAIMP